MGILTRGIASPQEVPEVKGRSIKTSIKDLTYATSSDSTKMATHRRNRTVQRTEKGR